MQWTRCPYIIVQGCAATPFPVKRAKLCRQRGRARRIHNNIFQRNPWLMQKKCTRSGTNALVRILQPSKISLEMSQMTQHPSTPVRASGDRLRGMCMTKHKTPAEQAQNLRERL